MLIRKESKMIRYLLPVVMVLFASWARLPAAELVGVTVTPHTVAESMRYRRPRDPQLAARVQLFVTGPARPMTFAGRTPAELLQEGAWAWHTLWPQGPLAAPTLYQRYPLYVATTSQQVRGEIEERRKAARAQEEAFPVNLKRLEEVKK
jgi:hypothetical protein